MDVTLQPAARTGAVQAPPSKSMLHRVLIARGLSLICRVNAADSGCLSNEGKSKNEKSEGIIRIAARENEGKYGLRDILTADKGKFEKIGASDDILATLSGMANLVKYTCNGNSDDVEEKWDGMAKKNPCIGKNSPCIIKNSPCIIKNSPCIIKNSPCIINCRESGTTLRFLLPVAGALGIGCEFEMEGRLGQRPMEPLITQLVKNGLSIEYRDGRLICRGRLLPGEYRLPGNVSSQFISGLLVALPLLDGDSRLIVTGDPESESYIRMTEMVLRDYGVRFERRDFAGEWEDFQETSEVSLEYTIPGRQIYRVPDNGDSGVQGSVAPDGGNCGMQGSVAPDGGDSGVQGSVAPDGGDSGVQGSVAPDGGDSDGSDLFCDWMKLPEVEGDWSNGAFFLCMGVFSEEGVMVKGLNPRSVQGDSDVLEILEEFGADVRIEWLREKPAEPGTCDFSSFYKAGEIDSKRIAAVSVSRGNFRRTGINHRINVSRIPDLVPALAVIAAAAPTGCITEFYNAGRLRLKESDRLQGTVNLIRSIGGKGVIEGDRLMIFGTGGLKGTGNLLVGGSVDCLGDHRLAMAAALAASACTGPVTILGAECVRKSYPDFWDVFSDLCR